MISIFFQRVLVRFLTESSMEIKWEIDPSSEDMSDIGYIVYKSENPLSDFKQTSPELSDINVYRDTWEGYDSSKFKIIYYKVRAFKKSEPSNFVDSPAEYCHENPYDDTMSPFQDPVLDIVRRNNLVLEHERYRIGKPCIVFQKRTYGTRCQCFDPVTQRVTKSKCPICIGTGRVEGYHAGIDEVHINFTSLAKTRQIQQWGDLDPGDTQAWLSNFPIVKPEDIIINKLTNEYWLVKRIRTSFHLIISKQTLLVRKLNFDDIKAKLIYQNNKYRM